MAQRLPARMGDALVVAAREAYAHGMRAAAVAGVVVLLGAVVLASKLKTPDE